MRSIRSNYIVLLYIFWFIFPHFTYAQVYSIDITPNSPKPGDLITINLQSKPNNKINLTISKNRAINVTNNEFSFTLEKFEIQQNTENIQLEVKNVELLIATVFINEILTTYTIQGKDGKSKIIKDLSAPGEYWVQLSGYSTTNAEQVYVNVSVQLSVVSDEKGKITRTPTFDEVKDKVAQDFLQKKQDEVYQQLIERLMKAEQVKIYEDKFK